MTIKTHRTEIHIETHEIKVIQLGAVRQVRRETELAKKAGVRGHESGNETSADGGESPSTECGASKNQ